MYNLYTPTLLMVEGHILLPMSVFVCVFLCYILYLAINYVLETNDHHIKKTWCMHQPCRSLQWLIGVFAYYL